jgi:5,10-methylenetetrahydromethanopterin reductase
MLVADLPLLSIRLHGGLDPRRCVELAQAAEANCFSTVWFAENPFARGILPAAAACAVATKALNIGIGVFNPYNRHPTLIAMEIGALDELAQGRARLGIGSGIASAVERMGMNPESPIGAVRDAITIVRGLLRGEEVDYTGRVFSAHKVKLDYAPPRRDLPILIAARGDRAIALAGEVADGMMISNLCPPDFTAHAAEALRAAAERVQRPVPAAVVQYVPCAARADRAEAYRLAKESLGESLPGFWALGERVPAAKAALLRAGDLAEADFENAVARLRAGERPHEALDDRFIAAFTIAGTADDCLAQAALYAKAGVTELVLTFVGDQPERDMAYLTAASARPSAA